MNSEKQVPETCSPPPSKTVNMFDLTPKSSTTDSNDSTISTKEKAARITLYVLLTLVVLTAVSLLLGEAIGLQWSLNPKLHNKTSAQESWYRWTWYLSHTGELSEAYQKRWKSLTPTEKQQELLRASNGEFDYFDLVALPKQNHLIKEDDKM